MKDHPAVKFGTWLKSKRQAKRIVARVFAGIIGLSPAEYAEVEAGIVHWIRERQEVLIETALGFDCGENAEFHHQLFLAREAGPLQFGDVFTREQLSPTRLCNEGDEQLTAEKREAILRAVFTPLT